VEKSINDQRFLQAYLRELEYFAPQLKNRVIKTIFFGGGTPSLMPINLVEKIIEKIAAIWGLDKNCEITLEANPTSFEATKFKGFRQAGINRLSIGIQALNDVDLKFLGRNHSATEAISTIKSAAKIFDNYSFDLIYARPNQKLADWRTELNQAIELSPNHLSLYQLTIEKGTKFYGQHQRGEFTMLDSDLAAEFYELTDEITTAHGLQSYEISNYARENFASQHNLVYWRGADYLGVGAGAHSRIYLDGNMQRSAIMMAHQPETWLKAVEEKGAAIQQNELVSTEELTDELILMALRLREGLSNEILVQHLGKNINQLFDLTKLQNLINQGLITIDDEKITITQKGRLLTNSIIKKVCEAVK
jgi:putative oxygen-independent coproporphyrinogen III oxidase